MSKIAGRVTNNIDPDQAPRFAASDLVLTVCSEMFVQILEINTVGKLYQLEDPSQHST